MSYRLKTPPHPGLFIKTEILDGHGLSITDGARALGVTRQTLSELTNARTALSPDMALRLEAVFGLNMETLLRMQLSYDIAQARRRGTADLAPFRPAAAPEEAKSPA